MKRLLKLSLSLSATALVSAAALAQTSADLELTLAFVPQTDVHLVLLLVRNKGPDAAIGASLQTQVPPGSIVIGALPTGCVLGESNLISCALGSLSGGASITRSFALDMQKGLFQASAFSSTPDPNPANNCGALPITSMKPLLTTGRLVCLNGSPRANCPITIEFHATTGFVTVATSTTDANGEFALVLPCATNQTIGEFAISSACCGGQVWPILATGCAGNLGDLVCGDCAARPGIIKGTKWIDLDQNGQQNGREPGLAGWTILLEPGGLSTVTDSWSDSAATSRSRATV